MRTMTLFTVCSLLIAAPASAGISCDIDFCHFQVPRHIKDGNFNFYIVYSFKLNETGHPIEISKMKNEYVPEEQILSCLRGWSLEDFENGAVFSVLFFWKHAVGWHRLVISGPGFEQSIQLTGERVPYRPVAAPVEEQNTPF